MKYNFLLTKIIFFIFFLFNIFTNIVQASNNAFIVMKVNNEIITNININEEYRYLIALNTDLKSLKKEEIFNLAKNSFLREKIKENELKKYFKLNQSSKYVDQTLKNLYKHEVSTILIEGGRSLTYSQLNKGFFNVRGLFLALLLYKKLSKENIIDSIYFKIDEGPDLNKLKYKKHLFLDWLREQNVDQNKLNH